VNEWEKGGVRGLGNALGDNTSLDLNGDGKLITLDSLHANCYLCPIL
jgi:uncharacterized protein YuzE